MKKVFTGKDVEELLASGKGLCAIPDKAVLTPSAKDAIRAAKKSGKGAASVAPSKPAKGLRGQCGAEQARQGLEPDRAGLRI